MKKFGLFIMVLGCVFASKANATHILELPDSGSDSHRIELLSSNVFDGQFYVWTYKVTSGAGSSIHALSHWVIGICDEYFDHAIDPGGTTISLISPPDTDPNLGISGLKFDDGYNDDEMRTVTIYMTQSLEVTQVLVGIKSGGNEYFGYIDGPSCDPNQGHMPEPTTVALIGAGVAGLTARRKKLL